LLWDRQGIEGFLRPPFTNYGKGDLVYVFF